MLEEKLKELKLVRIAEQMDMWLQEAARHQWSYTDFLLKLCEEELSSKQEKRCDLNIRLAKFPYVKTLESFDFGYQTSVNQNQIKDLSKCRWVGNGDNLIFLGPPGVGKTHLAVALGIEAIKQGYRTLFTSTQSLLVGLAKAHSENKLEEKLRLLCQPKLLIIDEIGYLPLDRHGASLFFQLITRRYEKGALILTSNQTYSHWGEVFGDQVLATAILDRLLHHAVSISIKGDSYRLKEKLKAGLVARSGAK
jgi:DNA replication protein DnaC